MSGMDDPDILYNDYVVIKLLNGRVSASLNFNGNGVNQLDVNGLNAAPLNDGKWHTITLIQEGQVRFLNILVVNSTLVNHMGVLRG